LIDALVARLAGSAESHFRASESLQFECHVLQDMPLPGAAAQAFKEAAAGSDAAAMLDHRWQPTHQSFVKARQLVGRAVFEFFEVQPGFQNGVVRPDVWSPEREDFKELHIAQSCQE